MTFRASFILALSSALCVRAFGQDPGDPSLADPPKDYAAAFPVDPGIPSSAPVDAQFVSATTWHARFEEYGRRLFGVQALVETVPVAVFDHARNFPHEWGQEPEALFDRLGSQYGQFFLDQSIQLAFWSIHREDSHYFREGHGNFFKRTGHALKSTVIVSNTNGGQTLAIGAIAGSYGSWAIATQWWEPKSEQTTEQVMLWGSAGLMGKAASNFFHEFWPDAKRKLFAHAKTDPLAAWSKAAAR